jgi:phosphatidylglycerophosphate synthase
MKSLFGKPIPGEHMEEHSRSAKVSRGFFSESFIRLFRGVFRPISRALKMAGVTPNMVTYASLVLGMATGVLFGLDMLFAGVVVGVCMGLLDIIDGQMAKEFGGATSFGGVLDSTVDRYNEFFLFAGFGYRYFTLERPGWIFLCAFAFLGSVMISYVKSRAESAGFECKVGILQRPERLSFIGVCLLFGSPGIDVAVSILAAATQFTVITRLVHVWRQSR